MPTDPNLARLYQGGSNQYMQFPNINPGAQPQGSQIPDFSKGSSPGMSPDAMQYNGIGGMITNSTADIMSRPGMAQAAMQYNAPGSSHEIPGGGHTIPTMDPAFTRQFYDYLSSQLGHGATPYGGQINAPENDILKQLQLFLTGSQSSIPGLNEMGQMAKTGMPTDEGPAWQSMIDAQQKNIKQNLGNIREQFAFGGALKSSPFGGAVNDYMTQTNLDQNSLLAQMHMQAQESARGRQMGAGEFMGQLGGQMGEMTQNMNQANLDRLFNEFLRTQPENSPLMQMFGSAATTSPNVIGPNQSQTGSILGGLGSIGAGAASVALLA